MPLIQQPANRITLTNISLVRLRKAKKRFEIACYKNKLLEYRSGLETDLDNVLQIPTIFLSVSKGLTAPTADLEKAFGKNVDRDEIVREILKKGEVQVGAGERKELLERVEREVVGLVAERVVDPETKRVYTTGIIRKALEVLSRRAGHEQQGIVEGQAELKDGDGNTGGRDDDDQAGYMGLGRLDLNDGDDESSGGNKGQRKKNNKKGGRRAGGQQSKTAANMPSPTHPRASTPEEDSEQDHPSTNTQARSHPKSTAAHDPSSTDPKQSTTTPTPIATVPTWTGVSTSKSPKALALEAIKALIYWQPIPIQRARMRLRISIPSNVLKQAVRSSVIGAASGANDENPSFSHNDHDGGDDNNDDDDDDDDDNRARKSERNAERRLQQQQPQQQNLTVKDHILKAIEQIESQDFSSTSGSAGGAGDWEVTGFVEPGAYKWLGEFVSSETRGRGRVEVLDMAVVHED